jgi:hypothetical protein
MYERVCVGQKAKDSVYIDGHTWSSIRMPGGHFMGNKDAGEGESERQQCVSKHTPASMCEWEGAKGGGQTACHLSNKYSRQSPR